MRDKNVVKNHQMSQTLGGGAMFYKATFRDPHVTNFSRGGGMLKCSMKQISVIFMWGGGVVLQSKDTHLANFLGGVLCNNFQRSSRGMGFYVESPPKILESCYTCEQGRRAYRPIMNVS